MSKGPQLTIREGLAMVTAVVVAFGVLAITSAGATDTQTVEVREGSISDHDCDSTEWHFVINQIDADEPAPEFITIYWGETSVNVDLDEDGRKRHVAHYTTTANLDVAVTRATAEIYTEWSGQFVLSHGPCDAPDPDPDPITVGEASMTADPECGEWPRVHYKVVLTGDEDVELTVTVKAPNGEVVGSRPVSPDADVDTFFDTGRDPNFEPHDGIYTMTLSGEDFEEREIATIEIQKPKKDCSTSTETPSTPPTSTPSSTPTATPSPTPTPSPTITPPTSVPPAEPAEPIQDEPSYTG